VSGGVKRKPELSHYFGLSKQLVLPSFIRCELFCRCDGHIFQRLCSYLCKINLENSCSNYSLQDL